MDGMRAMARHARGVDHVAIAVTDLDAATKWYTEALGFTAEEEKITRGSATAMRSRVLRAGPLKFVLVQGTEPDSNVSRFIDSFGQGVQHVAILVDDMEAVVADLKGKMAFDTDIIRGPHLKQAFTHRDEPSGMVFELVERDAYDGFQDDNVKQLFDSLEQKNTF